MLSAMAIFPNYYLTLCLNWSAAEMDADSVALALTGNPEPLQRALVKISTAQIGYLRQSFTKPSKTNTISGIGLYFKNKLRIRYSAIRFFLWLSALFEGRYLT